MNKKKYSGQFLGVCATIANKLEADVFVVRFAVVLLALFTGGGVLLVYLILGLFASEA